MRLPKLRGFKNPFKKEYQVVNVAVLAELFPQGGEITVADLVAKVPSATASRSRSWATARFRLPTLSRVSRLPLPPSPRSSAGAPFPRTDSNGM